MWKNNKITNYIIMGLVNEIINGWKNFAFPNKKIEELAIKRLLICTDKNKCKAMKPNKGCGICGCYIPAKVRSPKSHCPKKLW